MSHSFPITIYHNPNCGTSRNTLAMIRSAGYKPEIIEYMKAGWSLDNLKGLLAKLGLPAKEIMRTKGTLAEELGLIDPKASEETILRAMVTHPVLVNRPIVVTPKGAKLCRPAEAVLSLLEQDN